MPAASVRSTPTLFSVGYEGRDIEELLSLLVSHRVSVLVDVRLNAISRKPGFSKRRLEAALDGAGIAYRHARALGNPRENRAPFHAGDVPGGLRTFGRVLSTQEAGTELHHLFQLLSTDRVAVLCFERDHDQCHRQLITARAAGRSAKLSVVRLD